MRPIVALWFCALLITMAAALRADQPRPNVLLMVSDDERPDTIHALGNSLIDTPHLDRLVASGTAFTRAVAPNPICTPSRAEILSGCSSFRNGVIDFGEPIAKDILTWAATMQSAGYHTWYIGKWHNDGRPTQRGYEETAGLYAGGGGAAAGQQIDWKGRTITGYRGWVFQDDAGQKFPEKGVGLTPTISADLADAAIGLIKRQSKKPFFLHVNFTAPHDPLLMPPGYESKYPADRMPLPANFLPQHPFDHGNFRGRDELLWPFPRTESDVRQELAYYYAVISHLDAQIGRILAALDETQQAERTIVIFTSDHGVGIGSHGIRGKQNMYEHTIGVPLVMRGPGIPQNQKITAQCLLRDLYPTVCELTKVPVPREIEGRSLAPVLRGETKEVYPFVCGYFRNFQRMIRTDRWKLCRYPQVERMQLFDLAADPNEMRDLSADGSHAATRAELERKLCEWQVAAKDPLVTPRP